MHGKPVPIHHATIVVPGPVSRGGKYQMTCSSTQHGIMTLSRAKTTCSNCLKQLERQDREGRA